MFGLNGYSFGGGAIFSFLVNYFLFQKGSSLRVIITSILFPIAVYFIGAWNRKIAQKRQDKKQPQQN